VERKVGIQCLDGTLITVKIKNKMNKIRISFISDTHSKHEEIINDLPGGDLLIHAGDISSVGYIQEIEEFCEWFNSLTQYKTKVFIAGNHDWGFQRRPVEVQRILSKYPGITYLQDDLLMLDEENTAEIVRIWGSPWQPEFHNWAFNLPRNGEELQKKCNSILPGTDILITHGPAQGYLDTSGPPWNLPLLGCELLIKRVEELKPKIHVCGHIHGGYGYQFNGYTHFINASVLNERYDYVNKPITIEWDKKTNEIQFL